MLKCVPKSNYLARAIVNHVFCGPGSLNPQAGFAQPPVLYVALFTVSPTSSSAGVEVISGGYYRSVGNFAPSSVEGTTSNNVSISFPAASANWGTLVAFGVFDAATAGNLLFFDSLLAPVFVGAGEQMSFPPGTLTAREL
jgi:hypothetical protein